MAFQDPHSYLWRNICALLKVDDPTIDYVTSRVGVGRGTVQRIQSGESSPRLDSLVTIARKLRVPVWQLLAPEARIGPACSQDASELAQAYDSLPLPLRRQLYIMVQIATHPERDPRDPRPSAAVGTSAPDERPTAEPSPGSGTPEPADSAEPSAETAPRVRARARRRQPLP